MLLSRVYIYMYILYYNLVIFDTIHFVVWINEGQEIACNSYTFTQVKEHFGRILVECVEL